MSSARLNTLVTMETGSGRFAVLARYKPRMPWKQVDACDMLRDAEATAGMLEVDGEARHHKIDEWSMENWGDDAPLAPPTS